MKPKFNLAEFLAEPASPNASRKRSMANRGMQLRPSADPKKAAPKSGDVADNSAEKTPV